MPIWILTSCIRCSTTAANTCFPIHKNGKTRVSCSGRTTGTKTINRSINPNGQIAQLLIYLTYDVFFVL